MVLAGTITPVASAAPAPPAPAGDFYTPPSPLPSGDNGDLIRTGASHLALSVPNGGGSFPANATRIMYRSEDTHGEPIAVTGTYLDPTLPWKGVGPRPLVSFAVGTHGQGDQCAPSKLLNTVISYTPPIGLMTEYEVLAMDTLLAQGVAVVMTDYEGLGTPGMHTYVNRLASAHAVLDAARAAQRLPGSSIPDDGPVGMWGYSQGGAAAGAAAELAESYAPELDIKGTYAGAPPADLAATLELADGGLGTGFIGYGVNSVYAAYPKIRPFIDENINDVGKQMLDTVADQCAGATVLYYGLHHSNEFTNSGESISAVLNSSPEARKILASNNLGSMAPDAPVLIVSSVSDDLVPYAQAKGLATQWCSQGTTVQFSTIEAPPILPGSIIGHVLPAIAGLPEASNWMIQRFNGVPAPSNCAALLEA